MIFVWIRNILHAKRLLREKNYHQHWMQYVYACTHTTIYGDTRNDFPSHSTQATLQDRYLDGATHGEIAQIINNSANNLDLESEESEVLLQNLIEQRPLYLNWHVVHQLLS